MPAGESLQEEVEDEDEDDDEKRNCKARKVIHPNERSKGRSISPTRFPKINSNDCLKGSSDHEKTFRRWKKLQRSSVSVGRKRRTRRSFEASFQVPTISDGGSAWTTNPGSQRSRC
jgi:hypothetical protein